MWKHAHLSSQGLPGFNGVPGPTGPPGAPVSLFVFFLNDTFIYINPLYTFYDFFFFLSQGTEGIRGRQGLQGDKGDDVSCSFMHLYKVIYIYSYYIQLHTYNC